MGALVCRDRNPSLRKQCWYGVSLCNRGVILKKGIDWAWELL